MDNPLFEILVQHRGLLTGSSCGMNNQSNQLMQSDRLKWVNHTPSLPQNGSYWLVLYCYYCHNMALNSLGHTLALMNRPRFYAWIGFTSCAWHLCVQACWTPLMCSGPQGLVSVLDVKQLRLPVFFQTPGALPTS